MKKRIKKQSIIFSQDIPPYRHEMLVCVGASVGDVKKWLKRFGKKKVQADYLKWLSGNEQLFNNILEGKNLGYATAELSKQYLILILPACKDEWAYWESLIHELSHILDWICDWKMLNGETEARAYLHEWLFREIRRELQGVKRATG